MAFREIIEDGVTGLLFDAGDAKQLEDCIDALLNDPRRAKEMGDSDRARALQKFGFDRFVRDFVEILNHPEAGTNENTR